MQRYRSGNERERCRGQKQRSRVRAAVENLQAFSEQKISGYRKPDITGRRPVGFTFQKRIQLNIFHIRRGIEAVITGLTRNQFVGNHTRVRIPPSAPNRPQFSRIAVLIFYFREF